MDERKNNCQIRLPATAACELLIETINMPLSPVKKLNETNHVDNNLVREGVNNFTDMFRSVLATENTEFDFPEIAWPFDENDICQESNTKKKCLECRNNQPIGPLIANHSYQKNKRSYDSLFEPTNNQSNLYASMRRSKTFRSEMFIIGSSSPEVFVVNHIDMPKLVSPTECDRSCFGDDRSLLRFSLEDSNATDAISHLRQYHTKLLHTE
jgi:hypothetical protein